MNHEALKRIIFDQHEVIRRGQIVPRRYTLDNQTNYIITGLRRAGKSTLLDGGAREREIGNLVRLAHADGSIERLVIVTKEEEEQIEQDGVHIEVVPAWKFLLYS